MLRLPASWPVCNWSSDVYFWKLVYDADWKQSSRQTRTMTRYGWRTGSFTASLHWLKWSPTSCCHGFRSTGSSRLVIPPIQWFISGKTALSYDVICLSVFHQHRRLSCRDVERDAPMMGQELIVSNGEIHCQYLIAVVPMLVGW